MPVQKIYVFDADGVVIEPRGTIPLEHVRGAQNAGWNAYHYQGLDALSVVAYPTPAAAKRP